MGLITAHYSKPNPDQFEISLIGTGGGYGESILIHIGSGNWIIVDSCKSPSNIVLPLEYLESIDVDPKVSVKMIICTHWHDDHILGMSELLKQCPKADFCFGKVNDKKKFLRLIGLDFEKAGRIGSMTSTKEFNECLNLIEERSQTILSAYPDRLLYRNRIDSSIVVEVFSLSPSDETILSFDNEISQLITEYGSPAKKLLIDSPNDKSVVIYLKLGEHKALLGADLEVSKSNRKGWLDIVDNSQVMRGERASFFKIPHHGSTNGYDRRIWVDLLDSAPVANLSPYNRGQGLPEDKMIGVFRGHTSELYITSLKVATSKPKKRDRDIEKAIEKFGFKLSEVKYSKGVIRNRIRPGELKWVTDVFESATKI